MSLLAVTCESCGGAVSAVAGKRLPVCLFCGSNAIEEMARYDAPTVQSPPRITTRPVSFHGREIPAGEPVVLAWLAANHDDRQFDEPGRFDVDRVIKRHLGFGHGLHFCVGASLARLEARVAFEELLRVAPAYELDGEPQRWASTWLRAVGAVPIRFEPKGDVHVE